MSQPEDMVAENLVERHGRILARLAELNLSLAEKVHAQAMAAQTLEETRDLGLTLQRLSRSLRQTLALEARLLEGRQRREQQDRMEAERQGKARVEQRRGQVQAVVRRAIWNECDDYEAPRFLDTLEDRLDEDILEGDFADQAVEAHVARICQALGLAVPGSALDEQSEGGKGGRPSAGPRADPRTGSAVKIVATRAPRRSPAAAADTAAAVAADDHWRSSA